MAAITLIKDDHKTVESLFKKLEKAGDGAVKARRRLVDQVIRELTTHAHVRHHVKEEEQDWFPLVRQAMGTKALRQAEIDQATGMLTVQLGVPAAAAPAPLPHVPR